MPDAILEQLARQLRDGPDEPDSYVIRRLEGMDDPEWQQWVFAMDDTLRRLRTPPALRPNYVGPRAHAAQRAERFVSRLTSS